MENVVVIIIDKIKLNSSLSILFLAKNRIVSLSSHTAADDDKLVREKKRKKKYPLTRERVLLATRVLLLFLVPPCSGPLLLASSYRYLSSPMLDIVICLAAEAKRVVR